jgi:hypothetical protein
VAPDTLVLFIRCKYFASSIVETPATWQCARVPTSMPLDLLDPCRYSNDFALPLRRPSNRSVHR